MTEATKIPVACIILSNLHRGREQEVCLKRKKYGERIFDAAQEQVNAWRRALPQGSSARVEFIVRWQADGEDEIIWEGRLELFGTPNRNHPDTFDLRAQIRHIIEGEAGRGELWFYGQIVRLHLDDDEIAELIGSGEEDRARSTRMLDRYELPVYAPMERIEKLKRPHPSAGSAV